MMTRKEITIVLKLTEEECHQLESWVQKVMEEKAGLLLRDGKEGALPPLKFLAKYWNDHPTYSRVDLLQFFAKYLVETKELESGQSFEKLINELEKGVIQQAKTLLGASRGTRLEEIERKDFLKAFTTVDLVGKQLRELLAGLPPVDATAVTNVGLPRPEAHNGKFKGYFCSMPFRFAQIDPLGQMYLCCPQTLPENAGSLTTDDFMDTWNSPHAQEIRRSILDGSFKYCSEKNCGALQSLNLPRREAVTDRRMQEIIKQEKVIMDQGPEEINMSYDRSCNLACPSCRASMIILKGKALERAVVIHERVTAEHLKDAKRLIITGSGDPFGSKLFHSFLRQFDPQAAPDLRITLSTNGLLFTPSTWSKICNEAVDRVDVSVDGASPKSYGLNRGGDYLKLIENLAFIGQLRASGQLESYELHYVVQENNFREMKDFVELGLRVGCDKVIFKQLVNWGTYSEQAYLDRAVQLKSHLMHAEFARMLRDPIFQHPKVYLHDLAHLHQQVLKSTVAL